MNDWTLIFKDYKGKWVAITNKNIVIASGSDPVSVREKAIKADHKEATLFYVPKREGYFIGASR